MHALARGLLVLLGWLPLPVLHALGLLIGLTLIVVPNRERRISRMHVDWCLPELSSRERRRIVNRSLLHIGMAIAEAPAIWFGPEQRLQRWIAEPEARRKLEAIASRGAILLCAHIGAWELAGIFCATVRPMTTLYKPQRGVWNALIKEGRARLGANMVPSTHHGVKAFMRALHNNEMIGMLPDQDPPWGRGVFAPLFGIQAHTTELVTKMAARTGCPAWFCWAERLPFRGFRIHFRPAPPEVIDPAKGPAALNRGLEALIRELPQQYWWNYKRYRRRPPGDPPIYDDHSWARAGAGDDDRGER